MSRGARIPGTRRRRTLFVLPEIRDSASVELKNAIAARNACATEGRCPICGATGDIHADEQYDRVWHIVFEHEDYCPVPHIGA